MKTWLIEPRDPLIVRDGKPIGGDAPIETLSFPFPSTTAGAVRTRIASPNGEFLFVGDKNGALDKLKQIPVHGPILTEVDGEGKPLGFFYPAPRDAVVLSQERDEMGEVQTVEVLRLVPLAILNDCYIDSLVDKGLRPIGSEPVGADKPIESTEKPFDKAPVFWNQDRFVAWLQAARGGVAPLPPSDLGIEGLPTETRMHVVIQPGERVAKDGGLFQTKGLRFAHGVRAGGQTKLGQTRHFALSIRTPGGNVAGHALDLRDELAPIGGERRLARWHASSSDWPSLPPEILAAVKQTKRARIVLLTPAMFALGALPDWNRKPLPSFGGLTVTVVGACVGRPIVVSGWDMTKGARGEKPTRRLAPAGSVYFVQFQGTDEAIEKWVRGTWFGCVSDGPQDCLDGFGLAVIGVWEDEQ